MECRVKVGLLGPLLFEIDDLDITPTAAKQRQLFALLLARDSHVVPISALIDELWEDPPRSATTVIQTYVLSIRKQISTAQGSPDRTTAASDLLQTRARGYAFNTSSCTFDVHRYFQLANQAKRALSTGRDELAVDYFEQAERCWRGDALVDLDCGASLSAEADTLNQIRLANLELRLESQLRLRRYRDLIIDLTSLVAKHPFSERLHAYLMYALCLSGWRARAQQVFSELRKTMIGELGLEPCAKVQRLHNYILRSSESDVQLFLEYDYAEHLFWHGNNDECIRRRHPELNSIVSR